MTNESRRIAFDRKDRPRGIALASAALEAQDAYAEWVNDQLKALGVDVEKTAWRYEPLTGVATRVQ